MDTEGGGEEAGIMAEMPRNFKNLRACLCCSLIKSFDQVCNYDIVFLIPTLCKLFIEKWIFISFSVCGPWL